MMKVVSYGDDGYVFLLGERGKGEKVFTSDKCEC